MNVVIIAAATMLIYNILSVLLVQAEARDHPLLTMVIESFRWPANFMVTYFGVDTLQHSGHDRKVLMIATISATNAIGAFIGVLIGRRYIKRQRATKMMADF